MATKMCFGTGKDQAFEEFIVEYTFVPGLAFTQKQKNMRSFHSAIQDRFNDAKILEVSTKSDLKLGVQLSAFNLTLDGYPLECVFQSSKIFNDHIQFTQLLSKEPKEAKRFIREQEHLSLTGFSYHNMEFGLTPRSMFYDYIYILAAIQSKINLNELAEFNIFTDIEFNEKRSFNCQARSCAILSYLIRKNQAEEIIKSKEQFKKLYL